MANKIMLIRHGEKPNDSGSVRGIDESGSHDPADLSVRGWQRAGALVHFFAPPRGAFANAALATPDLMFAAAPNQHTKSIRSVHVVQPLAQFLGKKVKLDFSVGDEDKLVPAVTSASGIVLVAWEHDALIDIARGILGSHHDCPSRWPDDRFDLVWVLDHTPSGWTFTQVPQMVLAGDQNTVIEMVKAGP